MIRYLANRMADAMQARYNYDASYLREVAGVSTGGALRLGVLLPLLSGFRTGCPVDLWAGAAVASTREGDCGPCLQLVIDMAIERGAHAGDLRAVLEGDLAAAGLTGLGYRFALAAIADDESLESLHREVGERFGEKAVVSLAITAATGRAWPVIKRGLGHGKACQAVEIERRTLRLQEAGRGAAS